MIKQSKLYELIKSKKYCINLFSKNQLYFQSKRKKFFYLKINNQLKIFIFNSHDFSQIK